MKSRRRFFLIRYSFLFIFCYVNNICAQLQELNVPSVEYPCRRWEASWITCPGISTVDYHVLFFRKTFDLNEKPDRFIIHVSADNHYFLYVNGKLVTTGPARSDIRHWRYETIDIAPLLNKGKNVLAAQVNNWSVYKGWSQFTRHTAFLLQGYSPEEKMVNTDGSWKVIAVPAYRPKPVRWGDLPGYYGSYACDTIDGKAYPWGWQQPGFDDSHWFAARRFDNAYNHEEANGYWLLTPRTVPLQEMIPARVAEVVQADPAFLPPGNPFNGKDSLVIPPRKKLVFLLDNKTMTIGYPVLELSGGEKATVAITYAEALYYESKVKGNRNDIKNKKIYGLTDVILCSGCRHCSYMPLWLRPFRYVQLVVETREEPLVLHHFYYWYTSSPVQLKAYFSCGDKSLEPVWDMCWRTVKVCAQDILMSDASWEQLQYIGDSRIHALTLLYLSGDDRLMRNAIEQFDYSRTCEGMLASNYPNDGLSIIPAYSLVWIDMIYDYMMNRGDRDFIRKFRMGILQVLGWYENYLDSTGLLKALPYFNFTDWANDNEASGVFPSVKAGQSALATLQYVYSLLHAVKIFEFLNDTAHAVYYKNLAEDIKINVFNRCWDNERGLMAENPLKNEFSQHTNILAVLTNTIAQHEYARVMEKVMNGIGMTKTSIYYDFYLFEALCKAGLPEFFFKKMEIWKSMVQQGLTTTPETYARPRSDCHPWTSHPAYEMISFIAGIRPAEPGFRSVIVAPQPGMYNTIQASLPLPAGEIKVNLQRKGSHGLGGTVVLPSGMQGTLIWNQQQIALHGGEQKISVK